MRSVEKSAKTYEDAVTAALAELNAAISDVDVVVLEEGSKGLFGLFGSRPTKVRVTLREEQEEDDLLSLVHETEPKPAPRRERRPEPVQRTAPAPKEPRPAKEQPVKAAAETKAEQPEGKAEVKPEVKNETKPEAKPAVKPEDKAEPVSTPAVEDAPEAEAPKAEKPPRAPRQRKPRSDKPRQPRAEKPEKADKPEAPAAEKKPLPPKPPVKPLEKPVVTMIPAEEVVEDSAPGKARAFLKELTHLMGVEVDIQVGTDEEGNVFAKMTGDTLGVLIGRRGETLDALQYLTSLRINRGQEGYTRVTLDTENYRAKREDTLVRLANRMANRAVKTGRKVSLEPMNPYERRIIHSALQANEAVDTHSEGEEPNRHVVITLRKA